MDIKDMVDKILSMTDEDRQILEHCINGLLAGKEDYGKPEDAEADPG